MHYCTHTYTVCAMRTLCKYAHTLKEVYALPCKQL